MSRCLQCGLWDEHVQGCPTGIKEARVDKIANRIATAIAVVIFTFIIAGLIALLVAIG